tara:strand:- start:1285 stop:1512 length:228 start_codon:yes stop_codon:yes gene_type:complete
MQSIEAHIKKDQQILDNPETNPQMRRHIEGELHDLEEYVEHHKEEIEAGDHHDPTCIELFCDQHPDEPECLVYDD